MPDEGQLSPAEAADYIAKHTAELAFVARSAELVFLAYLLDVAGREARAAAEGGSPALSN